MKSGDSTNQYSLTHKQIALIRGKGGRTPDHPLYSVEALRDLFLKNNKSALATAKQLGVGHSTVLRWLKKFGIAICAPGEHLIMINKGRAGIKHHLYNNGRSIDKKGYVRINCGNGKMRLEHIVTAQKALGRELKPNEVVHHIDCNPGNNKKSNLLICDRKYHTWLHFAMARKWAQEHFG